MRSKDLKVGMEVGLIQGKLDSYATVTKGIVLSTDPWAPRRGSYGKPEPEAWPEGVLRPEDTAWEKREWNSSMPRRASSWTESVYSGWGGTTGAGALVFETSVNGYTSLTVVPLTRIKGKYDEVVEKVEGLRRERKARELRQADGHHQLRTRFVSARTAANLLLEDLPEEERPAGSVGEYDLVGLDHGGTVRLRLDQFEALVELARKGA